MRLVHRFAAAVCGTSCMTAYSYGYSFLSGKQFREPVLLSHLLSHSPKEASRYSAKKVAAAWLLHYGVGLIFSTAFKSKYVKGRKQRVGVRGLLQGAAFGFLGIAGWEIAFRLHPKPPEIDRKAYLVHLFPAHLIFGSAAALAAHSFAEAGGERVSDGK